MQVSIILLPMISVAFGQNEGKKEVVHDLAVIDGIAGDICHEPVPKLGECPANGKLFFN